MFDMILMSVLRICKKFDKEIYMILFGTGYLEN